MKQKSEAIIQHITSMDRRTSEQILREVAKHQELITDIKNTESKLCGHIMGGQKLDNFTITEGERKIDRL